MLMKCCWGQVKLRHRLVIGVAIFLQLVSWLVDLLVSWLTTWLVGYQYWIVLVNTAINLSLSVTIQHCHLYYLCHTLSLTTHGLH